MDSIKKKYGKFDTSVGLRWEKEDKEKFIERYRSLAEQGKVPEAKNISQMLRYWLDMWLPLKFEEYLMKKAIIFPESIDGNSNIRFSYQVEQNQFSQTGQYHLV